MPGFNVPLQQKSGELAFAQPGQPRATIDLARQYRWKFATLPPLADILVYAHKSGRPKVEFDRAQLHHIQDVIWFPGKQKWLPIDISFYHIMGNIDAASKIYQWWSTTVLNISTATLNIQKQNCTLELMGEAPKGGENKADYRYTMYGCWPSKVTPDELDYTSTKIGEITFTLEMDKAVEQQSTQT